jgi:hypothetical protein
MMSETRNSANEENKFSLLNFYLHRFELQREVIDRWFGYYLLIIAAPFPVFGGLLQIKDVSQQMLNKPQYIAIVSFFLFGVGLIFLLMHTRQRINALRINNNIVLIEKHLIEKIVPMLTEKSNHYGASKFGADFFVGILYIFINSSWFTTGMYLMGLKYCNSIILMWNPITHFAIVFIVQLLLRQVMLWSHETAIKSKK